MSEPFTPAGADNNPEDFNNFPADVARITKDRMLDVLDHAGLDLAHLLIRAAKRSVWGPPPTTEVFTSAETDALRDFARRGEEYFRWGYAARNRPEKAAGK